MEAAANNNSKMSLKSKAEIEVERNLLDGQRKILKSLRAILDTWRDIWNDMPNKRVHLQRMFAEQGEVAGMVSKFCRAYDWSHSKSGRVLNELDKRYVQIVEIQVHLLMLRLEAFMDKYMAKLEALMDAVSGMDSIYTLSQGSLDALIAAKTAKDLDKVHVPDLKGVKDAADVEALAKEWETLQLKDKLQRCIRQLEEVCKYFQGY